MNALSQNDKSAILRQKRVKKHQTFWLIISGSYQFYQEMITKYPFR